MREMGFKQLRQALDLSGEEAAPVAIDYTEVEQVTSDMLTEDSFFHFEIFGDNYHTEPIIGFAWGTEGQLYASTDTGLLQTPIFKEFLEKTPLKVYDFKRAKVLLSHLGISLQNPAFDSRLAKYLLSTVGTMKFQPLRVSIVRLRCRWTKSFMAREPKSYPRKGGPY